jgi:hypothetical protein
MQELGGTVKRSVAAVEAFFERFAVERHFDLDPDDITSASALVVIRDLRSRLAALKEYAQHKPDCGLDKSQGWPYIRSSGCTCGLARLET